MVSQAPVAKRRRINKSVKSILIVNNQFIILQYRHIYLVFWENFRSMSENELLEDGASFSLSWSKSSKL